VGEEIKAAGSHGLAVFAEVLMNIKGYRNLDSITIAILNENGIGVAGASPPSLVLGNFCSLIK